jgi:hypothetical protein
VSSPSDPQPPVGSGDRPQSSTQEIPMVQPAGATATAPVQLGATKLPPHPGAMTPAPVATDEPQPTGPVDFVPGLPGTPPVPPAVAPTVQPVVDEAPGTTPGPVWPDTLEPDDATDRAPRERRHRLPRDRSNLFAVGLAGLSLVLLELGLALDFGAESYWSTVTLWSAFATVCAALGLLAFAASLPAGGRLRSNAVWRIAAGGLVGLAVFWLLVVLPVVASDRGFLLTAALGALGAALWVGSGRKG